MKLVKMWYQPQADVEVTWTEVESLMLLSERHYDVKCRELGQQGGALYGMRNMFETQGKGAVVVYRLDMDKAQLVAKVSEADPALLYKFAGLVKQLNDGWRGINGIHGMKGL